MRLSGAEVARILESADNHARFPRKASAGEESEAEKLSRGLSEGIPGGWPFLVKGPAVVLEAREAVPIGELLKPHRTVRQLRGEEGTDWPMSAGEAVGPLAAWRRVGNGAVLTLAASPDFATASEHAIVEARKLLANAVRLLDPDPLVEIAAPASVEAVVADDPAARKLRVHLIAYNPTPRSTPPRNRPYVLPGLIEDAPIFEATIRTRFEIRGARAARGSTALARDGRALRLAVRDVHEVAVIEY